MYVSNMLNCAAACLGQDTNVNGIFSFNVIYSSIQQMNKTVVQNVLQTCTTSIYYAYLK